VADLSNAFHRKADESNDADDHDELHAAGMILHLDLITGDLGDGALMNEEYIRRWVKNLAERHNIKTSWT